MGRLHHAKFYTPSPVEFGGLGSWPREVSAALKKIEPTAKVWSPTIKPAWVSKECADITAALDKSSLFYPRKVGDRNKARAWKANVDSRRLCQMLVNQADILVAKLPKQFTWGTIAEIEIGISRDIPIFISMPDGPLGLFGIPGIVSSAKLIPEYIFLTDEALFKKLKAISDGSCDLPERDPERWLNLTYPNLMKV